MLPMYQGLEITEETIQACTFITHETAAITYESKDNPMMPLRYRKVVSLFLTLSESRDRWRVPFIWYNCNKNESGKWELLTTNFI